MELNHPFGEVVRNAEEILMMDKRAKIFFKFTCQNCGSRQTFDVPNAIYKEGSCEECGHVTNLEKTGCNFLLVIDA